MKRVLGMVLVFASLMVSAQPHRGQDAREHLGEHLDKLTAEQIADLRTKHATLDLDLDAKQEKAVYALNLEHARKLKARFTELKAKRVAGEGRPDLEPDQWYELEAARLDEQIAYQQAMKEILSDEQFEQFKEMHEKRKTAAARKRMLREGRSR